MACESAKDCSPKAWQRKQKYEISNEVKKSVFGTVYGVLTNLLKTFRSESDNVQKWCFQQKTTVSSEFYIGTVEGSFEKLSEAFSSKPETSHIFIKGQNWFFLHKASLDLLNALLLTDMYKAFLPKVTLTYRSESGIDKEKVKFLEKFEWKISSGHAVISSENMPKVFFPKFSQEICSNTEKDDKNLTFHGNPHKVFLDT